MKEINNLIKFIKDNIFLIIVLIIIMAPSMWYIATLHFNERIATLKEKIELLETKNKNLEEKKNSYKDWLTYDISDSGRDWSDIHSNSGSSNSDSIDSDSIDSDSIDSDSLVTDNVNSE